MMWQHAAVAAIGATGPARWSLATQGAWTTAWSLRIGDARYFVKAAPRRSTAMLDAEADGLRALAPRITVPKVCAQGNAGDTAFLALSWLELWHGSLGEALGRALAALHRAPQGMRYGWARDNFIGGTPQVNGWYEDWASFFRDRRLAPQFELARSNGLGLRNDDAVLAAVPKLLEHAPTPALLHGDLWSGNAGTLREGEPAVFDPAVYIGDREADLAMTRLFGGFDASFYRAYESEWPLPPGHEARRDVYNLYHVMNHLNLFGASYLTQAEHLTSRILKAL
jgi:fructosamine-3-kinase